MNVSRIFNYFINLSKKQNMLIKIKQSHVDYVHHAIEQEGDDEMKPWKLIHNEQISVGHCSVFMLCSLWTILW